MNSPARRSQKSQATPSGTGSDPPWSKRSIMKRADLKGDGPSTEEKEGYGPICVTLDGKAQIFKFADGKTFFTLLCKSLAIAWINDALYWRTTTASPDFSKDLKMAVEVAELLNVQWLDISGSFNTTVLPRNTKYEIILHAKLEQGHLGLDNLKYKVTFPDRKEKEEPLTLENDLYSWQEVTLDEFEILKTDGNVKLCIYCHDDAWKKGLVLGGVSFWPKDRPSKTPQVSESPSSS